MGACIHMESSIAVGKPRHSSHPQQPQHPQQPRLQNPNPSCQALPQTPNPAAGQNPSPMEIDGSRGNRGPLNPEERRRRQEQNLCAYCGQAGHVISNF